MSALHAAQPEDQVANFLEWADADKACLVALNYERSPGNQMSLTQARDFMTILAEKLGRKSR